MTDEDGDFASSTIAITVNSASFSANRPDDFEDTAPEASDESFEVLEDQQLIASLPIENDDLAGLTITLADDGAAQNGTVEILDNGGFRYTPDSDYFGPDTFTYTLTDADGDTSTATISIDVLPVVETNTITIEGISDDTGAQSQDFLTSDTTLTVFGSLGSPLASDEVLEVSTNGINWVPVSDVSGTSWSYDDPANHSNDFSYLLRIVASDASVGAAASQEVRIDTGAPAATITLDDAITADGVINAEEAAGSIAIGGEVGGEASVGDVVTLSIGGETYEGEVFDDEGTLRFSIEVPGSILADNPDRSVTASITPVDAAGNIGETATSSRDYGVDVSGEATITIDDLPDENTIATTAYRGLDISITGTAGADAEEGDTVTVSVNGKDYDGFVDDSGRYSIDVPASELVDQDNPDGTERLLTATVTAQDEVDNEATATATTTALVRPVYEVQFTDSLQTVFDTQLPLACLAPRVRMKRPMTLSPQGPFFIVQVTRLR